MFNESFFARSSGFVSDGRWAQEKWHFLALCPLESYLLAGVSGQFHETMAVAPRSTRPLFLSAGPKTTANSKHQDAPPILVVDGPSYQGVADTHQHGAYGGP